MVPLQVACGLCMKKKVPLLTDLLERSMGRVEVFQEVLINRSTKAAVSSRHRPDRKGAQQGTPPKRGWRSRSDSDLFWQGTFADLTGLCRDLATL